MINNRTIFIIIIFLLTVFAIAATSQDYFPLSIGNSWTYREVGIDYPSLPIKIIDTLSVNGDLYYYYGSHLETAALICTDSLGRIWTYKNCEKSLWFDFTLAETDSYFYKPDVHLNYIVKVNRNLSVETKFGILKDCIRFIFDEPNVTDVGHSYTFAPNLGIIEKSAGGGIRFKLDSAIIDGRVITQILSNNISFPHKVELKQNYPNPFNPNTTFSFGLPIADNIDLSVYDVLGKKIKVFVSGKFSAGIHQVSWDGTDDQNNALPSGTYLVRLQAGNKFQTIKTVLTK
jgi:hypothetical protein